MKCCPECGSTDVTVRYGGRVGGLWLCKECGYQGYIIVDFPDESLKKMKQIEKAQMEQSKGRTIEKD